ncbi:hypothetical protein KIN20_007747 [Parelaphostrongylus tenuis]|uniref:Uncharacterized protein n=1 Tax=Parelaphostrongylus tenuis TaxID=148309 RepID=A0AAD5MPH4_PARTN|nr:hypothetical protein KIN20_007747 [Parelaphostrongylus tenuis]
MIDSKFPSTLPAEHNVIIGRDHSSKAHHVLLGSVKHGPTGANGQRALEAAECEGKDFEVQACDAGPCPEWEEWNEWSSCTASCGFGVALRKRACLGGAFGDSTCPGFSSEQRSCVGALCPLWASWVEWGACSVNCGVGTRRRHRTCQYGTDCPGPEEETIPCYGASCPVWTEWSEWTGCSVKCGPGQRTRTRECVTGEGAGSHECLGQNVETTLCEGMICCHWSHWCQWSICDRECGGGQSIRNRTCLNSQGNSDTNCNCAGDDRQQRECNSQPCSQQCSWTQWYEWSSCSTLNECEIGIKNRLRQCVGDPGCHCFGPSEEVHHCRGQYPCPTKRPC